jgi:hypothetical protein
MKLTDKKIAKFFPKDNRFIHYCANRFGYSFFNDDVVNDARYNAVVNVMTYINKNGNEFKDEKEILAVVMSSVRYGILTAVTPYKQKKRVELLNESQLMRGSVNDTDDNFSVYEANCIHHDTEYGGYETLLDDLRESITDPLERLTLEECMLEGRTVRSVSESTGESEYDIDKAKRRVRTKFKHIIQEENERIEKSEKTRDSDKSEVRPIDKGLSEEDRYRRLRQEQDAEYSYRKTMSFLYS